MASYGLPLASTVTLLEPATTCALVITRSGAMTNPLPSNTFWQLGRDAADLDDAGRGGRDDRIVGQRGIR